MPQPVMDRTIGSYIETLGSSDPTPGGGSVAGVIGALGCGLGKMVIAFTRPDTDGAVTAHESANEQLSTLQSGFTDLAEQDEAAYQSFRNAAVLPRSSAEEKAERKASMQLALRNAASVPFRTCRSAAALTDLLVPVQQYGNPHLQSDTQIAMLCASTCFESARLNVNVNLGMLHDRTFVSDISDQLQSLAAEVRQKTGS